MLHQSLIEQIIIELNSGKVINVYGSKENGIDYFAENIENKLKEQYKLIIITINISSCRQNIESFYNSLLHGLAKLKCSDESSASPMSSLERVNKLLDDNSNAEKPIKIVCCLMNFDKLQDVGTDIQYDKNFFSFINGLRNVTEVGVLFTSQRKLEHTDILVAGKPVSGSLIDISKYELLPNLTSNYLQEHLSAYVSSDMRHQLAENSMLCTHIQKYPRALDFAKHLAIHCQECIGYSAQDIEREYKKFQKQESKSANNRLTHVKQQLRELSAFLQRSLGVTHLIQKISKTFIIIVFILASVIFAFYNHIIQLFSKFL